MTSMALRPLLLINGYRTGALNPATALTPAELAAFPFTPIGQGECFTIGPRENGYRPYKDPVTLKENNVPWRLNLNYKFSRDLTVYATVSRGFKDGVFPAKTAASFVTYVPVTQEQLTAYEAGFKAQAFDRSLSLNAAVFYYDYKDKQLVPSFDDPVFRLVSATANIPKSKVTGFDMDVTWRPVRILTLKSNLTYADSKVVSSFPDYLNTPDLTGGGALPLVDDKGNSFNLSPKWTSISDGELRLPVSTNAEAYFGATVTYNSVTWSDLAHSPSVRVDPFTLLDLRAGVSFDSGLDLMVWGKNVTNKYYWGLAYGQGDSTVRYANMPVTYGVTLRFRH
jgi:outer membrane receptor protein involved in Fe transport